MALDIIKNAKSASEIIEKISGINDIDVFKDPEFQELKTAARDTDFHKITTIITTASPDLALSFVTRNAEDVAAEILKTNSRLLKQLILDGLKNAAFISSDIISLATADKNENDARIRLAALTKSPTAPNPLDKLELNENDLNEIQTSASVALDNLRVQATVELKEIVLGENTPNNLEIIINAAPADRINILKNSKMRLKAGDDDEETTKKLIGELTPSQINELYTANVTQHNYLLIQDAIKRTEFSNIDQLEIFANASDENTKLSALHNKDKLGNRPINNATDLPPGKLDELHAYAIRQRSVLHIQRYTAHMVAIDSTANEDQLKALITLADFPEDTEAAVIREAMREKLSFFGNMIPEYVADDVLERSPKQSAFILSEVYTQKAIDAINNMTATGSNTQAIKLLKDLSEAPDKTPDAIRTIINNHEALGKINLSTHVHDDNILKEDQTTKIQTAARKKYCEITIKKAIANTPNPPTDTAGTALDALANANPNEAAIKTILNIQTDRFGIKKEYVNLLTAETVIELQEEAHTKRSNIVKTHLTGKIDALPDDTTDHASLDAIINNPPTVTNDTSPVATGFDSLHLPSLTNGTAKDILTDADLNEVKDSLENKRSKLYYNQLIKPVIENLDSTHLARLTTLITAADADKDAALDAIISGVDHTKIKTPEKTAILAQAKLKLNELKIITAIESLSKSSNPVFINISGAQPGDHNAIREALYANETGLKHASNDVSLKNHTKDQDIITDAAAENILKAATKHHTLLQTKERMIELGKSEAAEDLSVLDEIANATHPDPVQKANAIREALYKNFDKLSSTTASSEQKEKRKTELRNTLNNENIIDNKTAFKIQEAALAQRSQSYTKTIIDHINKTTNANYVFFHDILFHKDNPTDPTEEPRCLEESNSDDASKIRQAIQTSLSSTGINLTGHIDDDIILKSDALHNIVEATLQRYNLLEKVNDNIAIFSPKGVADHLNRFETKHKLLSARAEAAAKGNRDSELTGIREELKWLQEQLEIAKSYFRNEITKQEEIITACDARINRIHEAINAATDPNAIDNLEKEKIDKISQKQDAQTLINALSDITIRKAETCITNIESTLEIFKPNFREDIRRDKATVTTTPSHIFANPHDRTRLAKQLDRVGYYGHSKKIVKADSANNRSLEEVLRHEVAHRQVHTPTSISGIASSVGIKTSKTFDGTNSARIIDTQIGAEKDAVNVTMTQRIKNGELTTELTVDKSKLTKWFGGLFDRHSEVDYLKLAVEMVENHRFANQDQLPMVLRGDQSEKLVEAVATYASIQQKKGLPGYDLALALNNKQLNKFAPTERDEKRVSKLLSEQADLIFAGAPALGQSTKEINKDAATTLTTKADMIDTQPYRRK